MKKTILVIGAFDTKGEEYHFIKTQIEARGCEVLTLNWGVLGSTDRFTVDIENREVAQAGGLSIKELQEKKDQGLAVDVMCRGVSLITRELFGQNKFDAVMGMGKVRGTRVVTEAMQVLPIGIPKVVISTVASGDTSQFMGVKDINIFPSVVDLSGLNTISRKIYKQAVGAVCGMVKTDDSDENSIKPVIAITLFGQTKPCVDRCRNLLNDKGYEVIPFHATGTGGKTMESLIGEGVIQGVLDITTTEIADELFDGVFTAGAHRLEAAGSMGIPHVIVPGCMDMVNFGPFETVPDKYRDRRLYKSKPTVTLMRTHIEDNKQIGKVVAEKANKARLKPIILLPLKGLSRFDNEGGKFWWPEADKALFDSIKQHVYPEVQVIDLDCHINDDAFSDTAVDKILDLLATGGDELSERIP
jgi:uncharacterized protein (UPF0261 family)